MVSVCAIDTLAGGRASCLIERALAQTHTQCDTIGVSTQQQHVSPACCSLINYQRPKNVMTTEIGRESERNREKKRRQNKKMYGCVRDAVRIENMCSRVNVIPAVFFVVVVVVSASGEHVRAREQTND